MRLWLSPVTLPGRRFGWPDHSRVTIRPIEPADAPLLVAAFAELSEDSRYRRFFTPKRELDDRQLAYLTNVDHHDHEALVAIDASSGSCAGVARFVRVAGEAGGTCDRGGRPLATPPPRHRAARAAHRAGAR